MSSEEKKVNPEMDEKNIEFEDKVDAAMSDFFKNPISSFPTDFKGASDASDQQKPEPLQEERVEKAEVFEEEAENEELDEIVYDLGEEDVQDQDIENPEKTDEEQLPPVSGNMTEGAEQTVVLAEEQKGAVVQKKKSARPAQIKYVHMDDSEFEAPVFKKKHKGIKVLSIIAAMLLVSAGCVYAGMSYFYSDKFFEGTTINGIDCSGMTAYEVEQIIASELSDYSIEVKSRNQDPQIIDGEKINYRYTPNGEVLKLLKSQKPYEWILGYYETKSYTVEEHTAFDKAMLETEVRALECAKKENQVKPEDAYVAFDNTEFIIVPETEGSELNVKKAYKLLNDAISVSAESVDLDSQEGIYETAKIKSDNAELQATKNAYNNFAKASITYTFGEKTVTLDGETIKTWLQFDEKGQLVVNDASFQQHIAEYVAQLAAENDTVGTSREFYTTNGRVVYVSGSAYGWKIDQASEVAQLKQEIESGTQTTREPIYSMRANAYGYNDFGST